LSVVLLLELLPCLTFQIFWISLSDLKNRRFKFQHCCNIRKFPILISPPPRLLLRSHIFHRRRCVDLQCTASNQFLPFLYFSLQYSVAVLHVAFTRVIGLSARRSTCIHVFERSYDRQLQFIALNTRPNRLVFVKDGSEFCAVESELKKIILLNFRLQSANYRSFPLPVNQNPLQPTPCPTSIMCSLHSRHKSYFWWKLKKLIIALQSESS